MIRNAKSCKRSEFGAVRKGANLVNLEKEKMKAKYFFAKNEAAKVFLNDSGFQIGATQAVA